MEDVCLPFALGLATPLIVTSIYRRYHKWWRQSIRMEDTRNLIETDEYRYKYPVFVSGSSYMDDEELRQLSMALERQIQISCRTDRQLVCSGDNIEPGQSIFSETTSLLEEAGMMVIVISNVRNKCGWCEADLQQALVLDKPILVFQFGDVEQKTMDPILRKVIRKNVPITMDDEYNISPDWESVCNVILQLLPCRLDSNEALLLLHSLFRPFLNVFNVIRQQY